MADLLTIPIALGVPDQAQTTTLDGRPFRFRFRWIGRIERWMLDLETDAGAPILRCKGLVLGSDILRQTRHNPEAPQGVLAVVDTLGAGVEAGLYTLGARHLVIYFGADADRGISSGSGGAPPLVI